MKNFFMRRAKKYLWGACVLVLAFSVLGWTGGFSGPGALYAAGIENAAANVDLPLFDRNDPHVQAVMAVQDRHTPALMAMPGIVGMGTGLSDQGQPAIIIFARSFEEARDAFLPGALEGVPVVVKISGEFKALAGKPSGGGSQPKVDPTDRFPRPVPIGVSTGHPAITAGTIGARVTDGTNVYALSNNHVYANENSASTGDPVLQPGTYDGGAAPADTIGTLSTFVPIQFGSGDNEVDAAIALSSTANLDNATPAGGYGMPKSETVPAAVNLPVMKYGRTTGLTKGKVYAINVTATVNYGDPGTARFVHQIIITPGGFSRGGDSGSLIVVQKTKSPVGLLFAGGGSYTIANPIGAVLSSFNVTIDGE